MLAFPFGSHQLGKLIYLWYLGSHSWVFPFQASHCRRTGAFLKPKGGEDHVSALARSWMKSPDLWCFGQFLMATHCPKPHMNSHLHFWLLSGIYKAMSYCFTVLAQQDFKAIPKAFERTYLLSSIPLWNMYGEKRTKLSPCIEDHVAWLTSLTLPCPSVLLHSAVCLMSSLFSSLG